MKFGIMKLLFLSLKYFLVMLYKKLILNTSYNQIVTTTYSPTMCTPTDYKLTFIFDVHKNNYQVHGLWIDGCKECTTCGYPSCCNPEKILYEEPNDPNNFIKNYWFNTTSNEDCVLHKKVSLFEHEYYKHNSCSNLTTTTEYLNLVEKLYYTYYDDFVFDKCNNSNELWLCLDENFNYLKTECR